jgi:hypothetical protein
LSANRASGHDLAMLPRTRNWVESWDRVKTMPEPELQKYILDKCRNGFQVAKKPSRGQRDAWVTLLAEKDKTRDQLSPLAMRIVEYVKKRLAEDGYDFELNLDETGGVAYAEVHFKTLTKKGEQGRGPVVA